MRARITQLQFTARLFQTCLRYRKDYRLFSWRWRKTTHLPDRKSSPSTRRLNWLEAQDLTRPQSQAQTGDAVFPKGELSTTKNHTGNVWLKELNADDSTFDYAMAVATFDAGAKLDWHSHPGGQILLILEGTGYYQERGKPIQIVHKGD